MASRFFDKVANRLRDTMAGGTSYDGISASGSARQHNGHSYYTPQHNYGAPQHNYNATQYQYNPPQQNYIAPQQHYSPPPQNLSPPAHHYNPPPQNLDPPQQPYSPPPQNLGTLQKNNSPPPQSNSPPVQNNSATQQNYNIPQQNGEIHNAPQHSGDVHNAPQYNGNVYNGPQHTGNVYNGPQHTGNIYNTSTNNYASDASNPLSAIMSSQGKTTPLHKACARGDEDQVRSLLESGENIETQDADWMTPLQVAVYKNRYNVAKLLIDHNANVDAEFKMWAKALPPIILAALSRNEAMVRLLVDSGADIEQTSVKDCGLTPLGIAAKNGAENVVSFLLEKGADVEAKDTFGHTPLYWATLNGYAGVIAKLLQRGASTNVRVQRGWKSMAALIQSKPQIAHLFQQANGQVR